VVRFPVYSVIQRAFWCFVYINVREGEVAIRFSLHNELYVGILAVNVAEQIIQFPIP